MQYIPLPNAAGNTYVSNPITAVQCNQMTLRFDQEINQQNRFFTRFSQHVNAEDRQALADAGRDPPRGAGLQPGHVADVEFRIVARCTKSDSAACMASTARRRTSRGRASTSCSSRPASRASKQTQDPNIASLPAFTISGYTGFSGNAGDGRPKWQDRGEYEVTDNLTWIKGKHILKFGGRMYHRNILFTDARSHNGAFNYTGVMTQRPVTSAGTGVSFADFLLGYPASVTRSNPATWWGGYGTYWHGFFQDDFRSTNNLTINLGLRYEYTPWLTGYRNQAAASIRPRPNPSSSRARPTRSTSRRRHSRTSAISCSAT